MNVYELYSSILHRDTIVKASTYVNITASFTVIPTKVGIHIYIILDSRFKDFGNDTR